MNAVGANTNVSLCTRVSSGADGESEEAVLAESTEAREEAARDTTEPLDVGASGSMPDTCRSEGATALESTLAIVVDVDGAEMASAIGAATDDDDGREADHPATQPFPLVPAAESATSSGAQVGEASSR